jgi:anthranilate phosphoribosyltransferase
VILNGAAAIYVAGLSPTLDEAVERARQALEAGAGLKALERMKRAYQD